MTLILYYHRFSSYCHKAMMALHEKELAYEPFEIDLGDPRQKAELGAIWPYAKFPVLHDIDNNVTLPEASLIGEYADTLSQSGPRLMPRDAAAARSVRLLDRILDNYLHTPMQKIVGDRLRPEERRDAMGVEEARALIVTTYRLLESRIGTSGWIGGDDFSLADCSAAPPLFYSAKLVPMDGLPKLGGYLSRIMDRPSFRRCLDGARDFRPYFPGAASDGPWPDEDRRVAF